MDEITTSVVVPTKSYGNRTYTANCKAIEYSISYDLNGGTNNSNNSTKYTIEDEVVLATPEKVGYTFVGWSNDGRITKGSTGNKSFAASWEAIFVYNNGIITGLTSYGKNMTVIVIPSVIDNVTITAVGTRAFSGCTALTSIVFSDMTTWYCTTSSTDWGNKTGGTQTSLANSSTNATYFKSTYNNYCWYKI